MKIYSHHFPKVCEPFALCIGKFDGVHIGHRQILQTLISEARRHSASTVAYSFEPRPGTPLLTSREEKLALFERLGVSAVVLAELNEEFMAMTAESFIARIASCGGLKAVAVGEGFRFGRGATGDVTLLCELGARYGFDVHAIPPVTVVGQPVSSTLIRQCVKSGDVEQAAALLGREYSLTGEVVAGRQLARQLGFCTANILPPMGKVIPVNGVYACFAETEGETWPAMVNVGVKPTINGSELLIESHLIGFERDLYGKEITIRFVSRTRNEMRFDTIDHLAAQMARDRDTTLQVLSGKS